jgi:hypothetical protein
MPHDRNWENINPHDIPKKGSNMQIVVVTAMEIPERSRRTQDTR